MKKIASEPNPLKFQSQLFRNAHDPRDLIEQHGKLQPRYQEALGEQGRPLSAEAMQSWCQQNQPSPPL